MPNVTSIGVPLSSNAVNTKTAASHANPCIMAGENNRLRPRGANTINAPNGTIAKPAAIETMA